MEQSIEGDVKSFTLNYIDWKHPSNNAFHVAAEFSVERTRLTEARPDIVLFVNGIPFAVIECKAPDIEVEQAVSQTIRNQGEEYIPRLFIYTQLLLAVNKNKARYGTAGTPMEFWSVWNELDDAEDDVRSCVNGALSDEDKDALFSGDFSAARPHFDALEKEGERLVTEQDKCLHSLCRPERLLELAYGFTIFESGSKKIARYQQFFLVRSAMRRIRQTDGKGNRRGGIVWHTPGFRKIHHHGHAGPRAGAGPGPGQSAHYSGNGPQGSGQATRQHFRGLRVGQGAGDLGAQFDQTHQKQSGHHHHADKQV